MSSKKVAETHIKLDRLAIGARLRTERQRLGLTQGEVARHVGLKSKSAIKNYEKGQVPGPEILTRLAGLFGRCIDWLLTGRDSCKPVTSSSVQEPPALYAGRSRTDRKILKEVNDLLQQADQTVNAHLRRQVALLKRAIKNPK